ncbi:MAG TPA: aspartate kinase [Planctomycetota bacterium]|nr:aspartate kinase [Planctomycetota bacterium]
MIVMKFGGSSVNGADRIRQVIEIVRKALDRKPVVVVSAFRGVTDDLIKLAHDAVAGELAGLERIQERHFEAIDKLGVERSLVRENFSELSVLIRGVSLVKELTPRSLDYVVSFGERASSRIIAAAFNKAGIPASPHDAFDVGMITNDDFGQANPLPEAEMELKRHLGKIRDLPVVTGYIGKTVTGDITTLGRNGSDYTATIIGAALAVEEIQLWTDVDGVMTADPNIVAGAKSLEVLSFEECSELAYYGGRSLHPYTLLPAIRKNIPIRVLNTFRPESRGTMVLAKAEHSRKGVKSIAYKRRQFIVNVASPRMLMAHGVLNKIFEIFARHEIVINVVSTSEISVSVTTDSPRNLDKAIKELSGQFEVSVEKDKAIICVVGDGIKTLPGIAGDVFGAMKEAGVNVDMISQGASKINLAFVINVADVTPAVQALHTRFFGA